MDRVRIGYVKYLNTLPLVEGLAACREIELIAAVPSLLGGMLAKGDVDIALASVVDFATSPAELALLPAGGIGCDGQTLTVRLFSTVPMEQVSVLHADTDSHTSVMLARVLLKKCFGRDVRVVDFDARERMAVGGADESSEWPQTVLMIGDKVVTDSPPAVRYPHQLDLGAQWKNWTGLPFVYATWMCRAAEAHDEKITTAAALLDRQRLRNTLRTGWLVDKAVEERRWPRDLAKQYVTEFLKYEIGPRQREAVGRFLNECAAMSLLPGKAPRWSDVPHHPAAAADGVPVGVSRG